jgi:capsular polysaccharide export protein
MNRRQCNQLRPDSRARVFLFLQGPHGPFFHQLGARLAAAGAIVRRVGFTAGDRAFWPDRTSYLPFTGPQSDWPKRLDEILRDQCVTDLVLYGDTRPIHAHAITRGRALGLTIHVFEEGYLRPSWLTYERGGSNGNSRLMRIGIDQMRRVLPEAPATPPVPARWGETRQHVWYGALYHACLLAGRAVYPGYVPHRATSLGREVRLNLLRLPGLPLRAVHSRLAMRPVLSGGQPYHLVPLQLDHDSNFLAHGPYRSTRAFVDACTAAFSSHAPPHHRLVFKTHPLDDGRVPLARILAASVHAHGLEGRVHLIRSGPLAPLLDGASSVVTVNSTTALQALWRGLPVRAMGRAVYGKPELVSAQTLAEFFAQPRRADAAAWQVFHAFLLATSQVPGGFYASRGRRLALAALPAKMLSPLDPYDHVLLQASSGFPGNNSNRIDGLAM